MKAGFQLPCRFALHDDFSAVYFHVFGQNQKINPACQRGRAQGQTDSMGWSNQGKLRSGRLANPLGHNFAQGSSTCVQALF